MFVLLRRVSVSVCAVALAACSLTMPPSSVTAPAPVEWNAPLPHGGRLTDLRDWWTAQDDPILLALIDGAQALSPTVAVALSRVETARANEATARAALLPGVTAGLFARQTRPIFGPGSRGGHHMSEQRQSVWARYQNAPEHERQMLRIAARKAVATAPGTVPEVWPL
jgi:outer membrane protein TolC